MNNLPIEGPLDIAFSLSDYRLKAVEAHYPNEVNHDNKHLYHLPATRGSYRRQARKNLFLTGLVDHLPPISGACELSSDS
jgi:hypothetical protein